MGDCDDTSNPEGNWTIGLSGLNPKNTSVLILSREGETNTHDYPHIMSHQAQRKQMVAESFQELPAHESATHEQG